VAFAKAFLRAGRKGVEKCGVSGSGVRGERRWTGRVTCASASQLLQRGQGVRE